MGDVIDHHDHAADPQPSPSSPWRWALPVSVAIAVVGIVIAISVVALNSGGGDTHGGAGAGGTGNADRAAADTGTEQQSAADAKAECEALPASGWGMSDTGFGLGGVEAIPAGHETCFYDGTRWWHTHLAEGALRAVHVTGVGEFPSMIADQPAIHGRLVWGVVATSVASVHIETADAGADAGADTGAEPPAATDADINGGQVFFAQVPAQGTVTVTAIGRDGSPLATS